MLVLAMQFSKSAQATLPGCELDPAQGMTPEQQPTRRPAGGSMAKDGPTKDLVPSKRNSGVRTPPSLSLDLRDNAPERFAVDEPNSQ